MKARHGQDEEQWQEARKWLERLDDDELGNANAFLSGGEMRRPRKEVLMDSESLEYAEAAIAVGRLQPNDDSNEDSYGLTDEQQQIANLLARGESVREIGRLLGYASSETAHRKVTEARVAFRAVLGIEDDESEGSAA